MTAKSVISYGNVVLCSNMSEVVHHHRYNKSQSDLTRYSYMCDECGVAFQSLDEYVEHYKDYHPSSIGTAIT
ncbi:MAG TPA: hypothetical protein VE573_17415 [Nitrososphaeraceae archaeon]|nr:hypothetical protein [Nitrososphaeraceae archaeon]